MLINGKRLKTLLNKNRRNNMNSFEEFDGTTRGPVNGEQFFVEDSVKERLELITLPDAWFTRWITNDLSKTYGISHHRWQSEITGKYQQLTGNPYIYLGGEFYPDIRLVHFTNRNNKPHEWVDYEKHS
jgi:hypothetical protein